MATKPIFVATHPRSCSTAFERVFMARRDILECVHEPFGDAFYYGPEKLGERFENDPVAIEKSGFSESTYRSVLEDINDAGKEGKRIFIKDMAYYLFSPGGKQSQIAPSLAEFGGVPNNPTVLPTDVLRNFQFTFLIRHPRRAIPSYYRCTVPPLDKVSGFKHFMPSEAGFAELRRFFDFLVENEIVDRQNVVVIDADDMLDNPEKMIRRYCERVGIDFQPGMLEWNERDSSHAAKAFAKWNGFHNDAIRSSSLRPRTHAQKTVTKEIEDQQWTEKYGEEGRKVIRACVDANVPQYEYLKKFALRI